MCQSVFEAAHKKMGSNGIQRDPEKSQSKIAVQNFTTSPVCNFVFESYGSVHVFRAIWESRQSADCVGILRILRLPRQSAIAVYN